MNYVYLIELLFNKFVAHITFYLYFIYKLSMRIQRFYLLKRLLPVIKSYFILDASPSYGKNMMTDMETHSTNFSQL